MLKIDNVAIVGGTHGNEYTGAYLASHWQKHPHLVARDGFKTEVILANSRAFKECRRYVDRDLNRTCSLERFENKECDTYEDRVARELRDALYKRVDFIVDLHTTTANMGSSLVVSSDSELTWLAAAYLSDQFEDLRVYRWQGDIEGAYVNSLADSGFAIEVGAVPQGILRADVYLKTEQITLALLDFFELYKQDRVTLKRELYIYEHVALVDYPRDSDNNLIGMIHPDLQDRDFKELHSKDALFLTFDAEVIEYDGEDGLFALFVNEAAYYEKGFALCLARKVLHKF